MEVTELNVRSVKWKNLLKPYWGGLEKKNPKLGEKNSKQRRERLVAGRRKEEETSQHLYLDLCKGEGRKAGLRKKHLSGLCAHLVGARGRGGKRIEDCLQKTSQKARLIQRALATKGGWRSG